MKNGDVPVSLAVVFTRHRGILPSENKINLYKYL